MPSSLVGPSHHVFFGSLHRRNLWLGHLAEAFAKFAAPEWTQAKITLDREYRHAFGKMARADGMGLRRPLLLQKALDDTPVDSFLASLSDDLDEYQARLLTLMQTMAARQGWADDLDRVSLLWGRELANECLAAPTQGDLVQGPHSIRGVFEAVQNVVEGGHFFWKPFLLRRYTDTEVQYELRHCPHRRAAFEAHPKAADLACRFDSMVFRGFAEALLSNVNYGRLVCEAYCLDELRLLS